MFVLCSPFRVPPHPSCELPRLGGYLLADRLSCEEKSSRYVVYAATEGRSSERETKTDLLVPWFVDLAWFVDWLGSSSTWFVDLLCYKAASDQGHLPTAHLHANITAIPCCPLASCSVSVQEPDSGDPE